jgi:DNA-binding beta-propeller fold protein YncE
MFRFIPTPLLLLVVFLLLSACAATPPGEEIELPVFPPPPDEPRFLYERSLISSADVEIESDESQFKRWITGARRTGIGMGKPFGITVHRGRNGNLYVCDATLKQVLVFDRDGKYLRRFGEPEMFDRPAGLTVNPNGNRLFVVDTGGVTSNRHRVLVFDAWSGSLLHTISKRGQGEGELNLPRDATIGEKGNLYVVDGGNFRVQEFTPDGEFVRSIGAVGRQPGQFSRPKGIGVDKQGNIYVADTAFGNFQIFNPEGQLLLPVGTRNSIAGPARFMLPAGLAVDEDGRIYMVDQYFRKVDVFRPAKLPSAQGWLVYDPSLKP